MNADAIDEGKCVKTIVLIRPMRFDKGPAKIEDTAHRNWLAEVMSPRVDFDRWNFWST